MTVDRLRLLAALEAESSRFVVLLGEADPGAVVPTCPDWDVASLASHVGMIHRWVTRIVQDREQARIPKPVVPHEIAVVEWFQEGSADLVRTLEEAPADLEVWNWSADAPAAIDFWVRRMLHETLVHRLDLELALDVEHDPVTAELASDGIDELLEHFVGGVPDWAGFTSSGAHVHLHPIDGEAGWHLELGRCVGTTPRGREVDLPGLVVKGLDDVPEDATVVRGGTTDLHHWLWGRAELHGLEIRGDAEVAQHLRETVADATT